MSKRPVSVGIPEPRNDIPSLLSTALATKEAVETLLGQRGNMDGAATLAKLIELGVLKPEQVGLQSSLAPDPPDFEWTPRMLIGGSATGITYAARAGLGYKDGKQVQLWFDLSLSSKGAGTGSVYVDGYPYPALGNNFVFAGSMGYSNNMAAGQAICSCYIASSTAAIVITNSQVPGTDPNFNTMIDASLTNTSRIIGQISYITDY